MRNINMADYTRFSELDPATKRIRLKELKQGSNRSLFDADGPRHGGVDESIPTPVEAFRIDVYEVNGATRTASSPRAIGEQALHATVDPLVRGMQPAPTAAEYLPKQN